MDTLNKINKSKYLTPVPTNERKEKLKNDQELQSKLRDLIKSITKKSDDYNEKCMKIKLNSDDKLPLTKAIEIPMITINVNNKQLYCFS